MTRRSVEAARLRVAATGQVWRLRLVAETARPTTKTRRELNFAVDQLDDAIATMLETAYRAEIRRTRTR